MSFIIITIDLFLIGLAAFVAGMLAKFYFHVFAAFICWAMAIFSFFISGINSYWLLAIAALFVWIIPGFISNAIFRKKHF